MAESRTLRINGKAVVVGPAEPSTPLLYLLRNDADLHGPHFGCGLGQCGACTIHVNGEAVRSCIKPLSSIRSTDDITPLEGLGASVRLRFNPAVFASDPEARPPELLFRGYLTFAFATAW